MTRCRPLSPASQYSALTRPRSTSLPAVTGEPEEGAPHVLIVRPPGGKLTWLRAMGSRRAAAITAILSFFTGILITDGYTAYQQMLGDLSGIQQCAAHVIRRCRAVSKLGPGSLQSWAEEVIIILRQAHLACEDARSRGQPPDPQVIKDLRARYDEAVSFGITHNRHRDWHDGNHPGYALGSWLRGYADQVWLFTSEPAVEWTNNVSEHGAKAAKRHQAVSGYWHTQATLARWCRIRSYLDSATAHGLTALDAVSTALAGKPWLPPLPASDLLAAETAGGKPPLNGHLKSPHPRLRVISFCRSRMTLFPIPVSFPLFARKARRSVLSASICGVSGCHGDQFDSEVT